MVRKSSSLYRNRLMYNIREDFNIRGQKQINFREGNHLLEQTSRRWYIGELRSLTVCGHDSLRRRRALMRKFITIYEPQRQWFYQSLTLSNFCQFETGSESPGKSGIIRIISEECARKQPWPNLIYCSDVCLKVLRKTTKNLNHKSLFSY